VKYRCAPSWNGAALDADGVHAIQRVTALIDAAASIAILARFQSLDLLPLEERHDEYSVRLTSRTRLFVRLSDGAAPELEIVSVEVHGP